MQVASTPAVANRSPALETIALDVGGMKCAGCVRAVERQLLQHPGVASACVNLMTEVAVVRYDSHATDPSILVKKLTERGFPSQARGEISSTSDRLTTAQRKQEETQQHLQQLATAGVLLFFSGLGHLQHWGGPAFPILSNIWFHWGLATLALLFPGREILVDGARGLRYRTPNMNSLVGLGTLSAYLASCVALLFPQLHWECFFDEPVMLLGFILLGRILEGRARSRATAALEQLLALQPAAARLIGDPHQPDNQGIEVPVEQVRVGEWVQVLPGERIPVDGTVTTGRTAADESMLTGESTPVFKQVGDEVTAGTLNQSGAIAIAVTRTGQQTTLARIIALVEQAQTRKAPVQKLADAVAGYFAYGVMAIAVLTFLFWQFAGTQIWPQVLAPVASSMSHLEAPSSPLLLSLKLAISVLVVACPCALGLATPTAIVVGTSLGAERGILIKGGDILERVRHLDTVVFDKTGTLTLGQPTVTDCNSVAPGTENTLLQLAATAESGTQHPLAKAIQTEAQRQNLPLLAGSDFQTELGGGISAEVEGKLVWVGSKTWLMGKNVGIPPEIQHQIVELGTQGKTVVCIAVDREFAGIIALQDRLREDAKRTAARLQQMGLEVVLLTGDRPEVASTIARETGINRFFAEIRPDQKAEMIQFLQSQQDGDLDTSPVGEQSLLPKSVEGEMRQSANPSKIVAMVGDGANDAPALAQADVGISLDGSTDIAVETAGIVLMGSCRGQSGDIPLWKVIESIHLSLATFSKIRQNLGWALGYNVIAIPIAAGALLPQFGVTLSPALAGGFMACSSLLVVGNSLLLRHQVKFSLERPLTDN